MKSNMSSLSKKILFFWVFAILCNLTTSDDLQDCINNLSGVFEALNGPQENFEIAMFALSKKLLSSIFTPHELYQHFVEHNDAVNNIGAGVFRSKHEKSLKHYGRISSVKAAVNRWKNLQSIIERVVNSRPIEDSSSSIGDSSSATEDSSSSSEDSSSLFGDYSISSGVASLSIGESSSSTGESSSSNNIKKQADILGYFRSFAKKIRKNGSKINNIMMSPQEFCKDHADYDEITCYQALCTMLNLETTEIDRLRRMSGSRALRYCFLNYTYLDFTTDTFFPQSDGSSSSSSSLDEFSKQNYIDIMIEYFNHLIDVSTQIGEFNKKIGRVGQQRVGSSKNRRHVLPGEPYQDPPIFLSIVEYCQTAVENNQ